MESLGPKQGKHQRLPLLMALAGMLFWQAAAAQDPTALHEFSPRSGHPRAAVIEVAGGVLLGTTTDGGLYGRGSIYSLTPDGGGGFTFSETYSFTGGADGATPQAALVEGPDGALYGVVSGGSTGLGLIYRVDSSGHNFAMVHEFQSSEGSGPASALITGSDGLLYGTTTSGGLFGVGTVFAFDSTSGDVTVIHSFDYSEGAFPQASVLEGLDGLLYGVTFGGGQFFSGVAFKLEKSGANFAVLYEFGFDDGGGPFASLIQLADGSLYGAASNGGTSFGGTLFTLQPDGTGFQVLHAFAGPDGQSPQTALVQAADGLLYGTTSFTSSGGSGTVFRIDTGGTNFELLHTFQTAEGQSPAASLLRASDDALYGTTQYGGAGANGTVYEFSPTTAEVSVLHSFLSSEGFRPVTALVRGPGGYLYGTTLNGSEGGFGSIFRMDSGGGSYSILHAFDGTDGLYPEGSLLVGSDGSLYGTTNGNSQSSFGNVFRMSADGSSFTVLHEFAVTDGNQPFGALVEAANGFLYGTTLGGGANGLGVIYRVSKSGQNFSVVYSFPFFGSPAGLLQASDGRLYGTTFYGGTLGYGTVFGIDASGANFKVIHEFTHADGAWPAAALIQLPNGKLYGTTSAGTDNEQGVVFRLDTSGKNFSVLHAFTGPDGSSPYSPLLAAGDGYLYGTTFGGGVGGAGTVFRLKPAGDGFAVSHGFSGSDGGSLFAGLIQGEDGALYGAARDGGTYGGGVAFRLDRAYYRLVVTKSGTGSGAISTSPSGISCGGTCAANFAVGSTVTMTPTATSNSLFGGWTGDADCSDGSVTMSGDKACTAVFNLGPDLIIESVDGSSSAPPGGSVTLIDKTRNRGAAAVATSVTKFYLSVDSTLDGGDLLLGSRNIPALAPGASSQGSVVATIPAGQAKGHYFVLVVANADGARTETDETNNTRSKPMNIF